MASKKDLDKNSQQSLMKEDTVGKAKQGNKGKKASAELAKILKKK